MAESYISKVKLPGDTTVYTIKDKWARDEIEKLSNATHFLGKTSTALSDGASTATITIGTDTYAVSPTTGQKQLNNGDIVVASGDAGDSSDEGTEYICAIPGEGTATITWYKFGSAKLNELGQFAYANSGITARQIVTGVGSAAFTYATGSISSITQPTITVTPSTAAVKVSVSKDTWVTGVAYSKATAVSYSKVTGVSYNNITAATAIVDSSATFTGTTDVNVVTAVTGGTGIHIDTGFP